MPELPEVETLCRGLKPHLEKKQIKRSFSYKEKLRYPIPNLDHLENTIINSINRRGKYLIFNFDHGNLLVHLGMSGVLRLFDLNDQTQTKQKHDHIEFYFDDFILRYNDPRRFGLFLWQNNTINIESHPLLASLGPEPLGDQFTSNYLYQICQKKKRAIKLTIMDSKCVTGVGNIYASEALFKAKIHPQTNANQLNETQCTILVEKIKETLSDAISQGGTTLKDFKNQDGKPGYFAQKLLVYGKENEPCLMCKNKIEKITLGQRSTFFCSNCQKIPT